MSAKLTKADAVVAAAVLWREALAKYEGPQRSERGHIPDHTAAGRVRQARLDLIAAIDRYLGVEPEESTES